MVNLVPVGGGELALTHRPKKKDVPALRAVGVTHVVTLLTESEGAKEIGALVANAGMAWLWCPLRGADVQATVHEVGPALAGAASALSVGGVLVVHCSAGIHRTGMFGYALLRCVGLDAVEAVAKLRLLREVTADGVGDERIRWGDHIAELLRSA